MEKVFVVYVKYSFDVMKENHYRYDVDIENDLFGKDITDVFQMDIQLRLQTKTKLTLI